MKKKILLLLVTAFGALSLAHAQSGKYLSLDGASFMEVATSSSVNIPDQSDFTLTCWVNLDPSATLKRIISNRDHGGNSAFELITGSQMQFGINLSDASGAVGPPFSSGTIGGAWHHLAMVIDRTAGTATIYIDGQQEQQSTNNRIKNGIFSNTNPLYIGALDGQAELKGQIDDIRMWSKAFSQSEINQDMTSTINGTENDLLAAWDFENVSGNTVPDISGNGNEGTLHGNPAVEEDHEMEFEQASFSASVLPVGIGEKNQRILTANIRTSGTIGTTDLTSFTFKMDGTSDIQDVENIHLYYGGKEASFNPATATKLADINPDNGELSYTGQQELANGSNYFFITYDLSANAQEGNEVSAAVLSVTVGGEEEQFNPSGSDHYREIVLTNKFLFQPGDGGADSYRIPAIATAKDGSLIVAADKRNNGSGDLRKNGNIDIVVKRSTDNGKTWSSPLTIAGEGTNYCYGDAALIVDDASGDVICVFNGNTGFFQSDQNDWVHLFVSRSSDNGETWSAPEDITDQIYGPNSSNPISKNWLGVFITSGRLTQLSTGRILGVMPVREPSGNTGLFTMYSDDGGHHWDVSTSNAVPSTNGGGNESKTVELDNGDVLMSIRTRYTRRYNISKDGGITWGTAYSSTLSDPGVDGDIIRYSSVKDGDDQSILIHSLAHSPGNATRKDVSLYVSFDEGETWPIRKSIDPGPSAYSSVTVLDDGSLGVFYEDGEEGAVYNLAFTRVSMDWLQEGYTPPQELEPVTPNHSLSLDGLEQYMSVENNNAFNISPGEDYSISLWIKGSNQTNTFPRIIAKRPGASGVGYELWINKDNKNLAWNMNNNAEGNTPYSSQQLIDGKWHHVVITVDNSSTSGKRAKVYIDGNKVTESTNEIPDQIDFSTPVDLLFGAANTSPESMFYTGEIDDIHIYSKVLTAAERTADQTTQVSESTPDLLAAWDFENITDNTVEDISGNNHPGILHGYVSPSENDTLLFSSIPQDLQFFARDDNDEAMIEIAGEVVKDGFNSIKAEFYKAGNLYDTKTQNLQYSNDTASFNLSGTIKAELKEYKIVITLTDDQNQNFVVTERDSLLCGDVFGIMGQSNSHPTRKGFTLTNEFVRSFGIQTGDTNYDPYNPADTTWGIAQAEFVGDNSSIAAKANNPTFYAGKYMAGVWGVVMGDSLQQKLGIPVCIINGGAGSSTIEQNLPQGDGHYDLNTVYGRMMYRVKKSGLQEALKAMFWHQGEKNADASWEDYPDNFNTLYTAWHQDLPGLDRVYVFQTNLNGCYGSASTHQADMREWQRSLNATYSDVRTISSAGIPGTNEGSDNLLKGCHYSTAGYEFMGKQAYYTIAQDLYNASFTSNVTSPNIKEAYYTDDTYKQINLVFDNEDLEISDPNNTGKLNEMKDYFYFDDSYGNVNEMIISEDTVKFIFNSAQQAQSITYLPPRDYNNGGIYLGPYLTNAVGGGALTFKEYPLEDAPEPVTLEPVTPDHSLSLDGIQNYMSVEDHEDLNIEPDEDYTVALWIKSGEQTNNTPRILAKRPNANGTGYEIFQNGSTGKFAWNMGPSGGTSYSSASLDDEEWHHLVVTVDNSSSNRLAKVYIDGQLTTQSVNNIGNNTDFTNTKDLFFGVANIDPLQYFYTGELDDIRIYGKLLSSQEMQEDRISQVDESTPNLIAAWDFEDVQGNTVPDISGNNHPGILHGDFPMVESNNLEAKIENEKDIKLSWTVTKEVKIQKYEIQKSTDGNNFQKLTDVTAQGESGEIDYSYTDEEVAPGTYFYRWEAIDEEGNSVKTSNTEEIEIEEQPEVENNDLEAKIENEKDIKLSWTVTKEVKIQKYEIQKSTDGNNFQKLTDVIAQGGNGEIDYSYTDEEVAPGTYFYRWEAIDEEGNSVKTSNTEEIEIEEQPAVENNDLEAKIENEKDIKLSWTVTKEVKIQKYEVQKSTDGNNFQKLTDVIAQGGNGEIDYSYTDEEVAPGTYFYRWEAIDEEGNSVKTSNTEEIEIEEDQADNDLSSEKPVLYPNPVKSGQDFTLLVAYETSGSVVLKIVDTQGAVLKTLKTPIQSGKNEIKISTLGLSAGLYYLKMLHLQENAVQKVNLIIQ